MKLRFWSIIWVLAILFPMAFLGTQWPAFGHLFNSLFSAGWVHVVMHLFLYVVLGILLTSWIKPSSVRSAGLLFGMGLLVGCFHEALQILAAGGWPGWSAEAVDLGVDLAGITISLFLFRLWNERMRPSTTNTVH